MATYHIHLQGIVQGVGFRPFVYQLAQEYGLHGWVNNTTDGVHIRFNATAEQANAFYRAVLQRAPRLAVITAHRMQEVDQQAFTDFQIIASQAASRPDLPLTPDFALCDDCRQEIHDPSNRRYGYAFTTCTLCGPRYSIITALPYDRPHTTMAAFEQCAACASEYHDPQHRRHFSQTNSCPQCGISLFTASGQPCSTQEIVHHLQEGKIVAVKGIGGYLLLCDASRASLIEELRQRKHRPAKPFALMYPSLKMLQEHYNLSEHEISRLTGPAAPILLLQPKDPLPIARQAIAPRLNRIGCMLPYAPLFELILAAYGRPVVATSANISGSPILYDNETAHRELAAIADVIVSHNRPIVVPQDDSVLRMAGRQPIWLRRSRGLAPTYLNPGFALPDQTILATGAQKKSSFALASRGQVYVSQYLGDMDNYLTQSAYRHTLAHFFDLLDTRPQVLVADKHPGYFTTGLAQEMADEQQLPLRQVQHHEAHFFAVLAENNMLNSHEPVMGVIWDGTGYGDDGHIWGGEFFVYDHQQVQRLWHLPYFPFILGDKMVREPRISALTISPELPQALAKFDEVERALYTKLLTTTRLQTSSMGRLFDAVAALLLDTDKATYEGEAALYLQVAAESYGAPAGLPGYSLTPESADFYPDLAAQLLADKQQSGSAALPALRFHLTLITLIEQQARQAGVRKVAFSGGVWQNSLLVELAQKHLGGDYELYFHQRLSPNDECVSLGQLAAVAKDYNG